MQMKILLCSVPDGSLERTLKPLFPRGNHYQIPIQPVGILRILSWMEKKGYSSDIYDINNLRPSDEELIKTFIRTIVMENRKKMKPAITDEEKGLQILAQGQ